jgi:hypothetical protein
VPGPFLEAGETFVEEPLAPLGHDLPPRIETHSDLVVVHALRRHQDNLGPHDVTIRQRISARLSL